MKAILIPFVAICLALFTASAAMAETTISLGYTDNEFNEEYGGTTSSKDSSAFFIAGEMSFDRFVARLEYITGSFDDFDADQSFLKIAGGYSVLESGIFQVEARLTYASLEDDIKYAANDLLFKGFMIGARARLALGDRLNLDVYYDVSLSVDAENNGVDIGDADLSDYGLFFNYALNDLLVLSLGYRADIMDFSWYGITCTETFDGIAFGVSYKF